MYGRDEREKLTGGRGHRRSSLDGSEAANLTNLTRQQQTWEDIENPLDR